MIRTAMIMPALALLLGGVGQANAGEIAIGVSGFNEQMVYQGLSGPALTATMDGGTSLSGNTWYSQAFGAANGGTPGSGLASGIQTSLANPSTTLLLAPFTANDALLLSGQGNGPTTGTFTLTSPGKYSTLSFFASTGSGSNSVAYTLNFADGSTQSGTFSSPDWFFNGPVAVGANGRWDVDTNGFNGPFAPPYPAIYQEDIGVIPSSSALTSISLSWDGGNGNTAVWGVSGAVATPEPATLTMLGFGIAGMAGYGLRRRKAAVIAAA